MVQIVAALYVLVASAASLHVLLHYLRAASAVTWLFAFWVVPFAGPAFYFLAAMYRAPRRIRRRRERALVLRGQDRGGIVAASEYPAPFRGDRTARLIESTAAFPLVAGNSVEVLASGDAAFEAMLEAIAQARTEVFLATYILGEGRIARRLLAALAERAKEGADVRLLYDEFGSLGLPGSFLDEARGLGIRTQGFLKPNPFKRRFQLHFRDHRKILVCDGSVAFTGGQNWSDEYSESAAPDGALRDLHARVRGPVAAAVRRVFLEDWCIATGDPMKTPLPPAPAAGEVSVRVIPHGPDEEQDRLFTMLASALQQAERDILLVTPYFVPSGTMRESLRIAALSKVRVRLLMPRRSDNIVADLAARRHFEPLLEAGVEVWLAEEPMLHAKALVVDGRWTTFGSANYDYRSFHCNYEMNLEVVGEAFATAVTRHFDGDFARARRKDAAIFRRRSVWMRALQNAANLLESWL